MSRMELNSKDTYEALHRNLSSENDGIWVGVVLKNCNENEAQNLQLTTAVNAWMAVKAEKHWSAIQSTVLKQ